MARKVPRPEQWDPQEAERLKKLAYDSYEDFKAGKCPDPYAEMKVLDAFSAYHRYMKLK